jgi:hypothetical protein
MHTMWPSYSHIIEIAQPQLCDVPAAPAPACTLTCHGLCCQPTPPQSKLQLLLLSMITALLLLLLLLFNQAATIIRITGVLLLPAHDVCEWPVRPSIL